MTELTTRIATALPAAALFLYLSWLGGWIFHALLAVICLLAVYELSEICREAGLPADGWFGGMIALWILSVAVNPWLLESGLILFLCYPAVRLAADDPVDVRALAATPFVGLYASVGLLCLQLVRDTDPGMGGFAMVVMLLLMVWGNDIFAYFGGKAMGRRLLAPSISPGKTWEGFLWGIAGSIAGYSLVWWLLPAAWGNSWLELLPAALLISLFGPLGDLTQSRLKRAASVKDSSALLPGHGGILDRIDALLLAAPVFYLYHQFILSGGG